MNQAATGAKQEPAIKIDESTTYTINAGRCDYCGNFKTWDFRVQNPKSGKMMPGHVTENGFKINNGDCPFFSSIRNKRGNEEKKTDKGHQAKEIKSGRNRETFVNFGQLSCGQVDGRILIQVHSADPVTITLGRQEVLRFCRELMSTLVD